MSRLRASRPVGFIEPCQPSSAVAPPTGPGWIHEIKHDGYRMMALRDGERVRVLSRKGLKLPQQFGLLCKYDSQMTDGLLRKFDKVECSKYNN